MGRLRGKRNRDQDRYWHERRKATQGGMLASSLEDLQLCAKCARLVPSEKTHKGWCLSCVATWASDTDPWLILQAREQLPPDFVPVSLTKQIERIQARVIEPITDETFLPLTQFNGSRGIGHLKGMWNVLGAMHELELATTGELFRLGTLYPNMTHLLGRHAPVQRSSLMGFLSRIHSAGNDFQLLSQDRHLLDYTRGFVSDNRILVSVYMKHGVDVYDRARSMRVTARYGKAHFDRHCPMHWPFEGEHVGRMREEGKLEELPDVVMEIGKLVDNTSTPASLREDLCQDLCVAVLSGETTIEALRYEAVLKQYCRETFKNHPLKYGRYSLTGTSECSMFGGSSEPGWTLAHVTSEDVDPSRADRGWLGELCVDPHETAHGWHEGHGRTKGLTTVGDVSRTKNDGFAIAGPNVVVCAAEEMDSEIAEVFMADCHPQWRRRLSD